MTLVQVRAYRPFFCHRFISTFLQDGGGPKPTEQHVDEVQAFLQDTEVAIAKHPLWRGQTAEELDITTEALERYIMHKIYKAAYSPKREDDQRKDCEFAYKVRSLQFVTPDHLDIKYGEHNDWAFKLASEQLRQLSTYRSPRDKVTCIMNCCMVVCNLLNDSTDGTARGADDLLPIIILVIIRAQPQTWWSDIRFIQRFRNPKKLSAEAGYYLTQMMGAVAFIEKAEANSFNIAADEFARLSSLSLSRMSPEPKHSETRPAELMNNAKPGSSDDSLSTTPSNGHMMPQEGTSSRDIDHEDSIVVQKFLECQLEDLTIGELGDLLKGYRALAAFYHSHKKDES
jgi:hypothetical protein